MSLVLVGCDSSSLKVGERENKDGGHDAEVGGQAQRLDVRAEELASDARDVGPLPADDSRSDLSLPVEGYASDSGAAADDVSVAADIGDSDVPVGYDDVLALADVPVLDASLVLDCAFEAPSPIDGVAVDSPSIWRAGSCDDMMDWSQSIEDGSTTGKGPCAAKTIDDVLGVIRTEYPVLADVFRMIPADAGWFCYEKDQCWCQIEIACVPPRNVNVVSYGDGFRIVMQKMSDFTQFKYHTKEYWYFETDESCHPALVGSYREDISFGSCRGSALWGIPYKNSLMDCAIPPDQVRCGQDGGQGPL
jgi:hypothetical protein